MNREWNFLNMEKGLSIQYCRIRCLEKREAALRKKVININLILWKWRKSFETEMNKNALTFAIQSIPHSPTNGKKCMQAKYRSSLYTFKNVRAFSVQQSWVKRVENTPKILQNSNCFIWYCTSIVQHEMWNVRWPKKGGKNPIWCIPLRNVTT